MMGDIGALKVSGSRSIKIAPGAVVCVESEIRGDVTIGARTVVHPKARIIAEAGPIIIGESNLIEEQVLIINRYPQKNGHVDPNRDEPITMIIGSNNVFEVDCQSEALKIDDNNIIESKARVGRDMILSSGCVVGACCDVKTCEVLPENTVIYGNNCLRRLQSEKPQHKLVDVKDVFHKEEASYRQHTKQIPNSCPDYCWGNKCKLSNPQTLQLDFLMKILPNYHHLKRSPKPQTPPAKS